MLKQNAQQAPEQAPIVKVPDNISTDATAIQEGIEAMTPAAGAPIAAPEDTTPEKKTAESAGSSAKGWAAVKKQEARLRQERERFDEERKAERHQLSQLRAEVESLRQGVDARQVDIRSAFRKDPLGFLKNEFGVTLNDLAQIALGEAPITHQQRPEEDQDKKVLMDKLDRLERLVQQDKAERHLDTFRLEIRQAASDEMEILQTLPNYENEVINLAAEYFKRTGERLPARKACGIVAKYWEQHLSKVASHKAARRTLGLPDPDDDTAQVPRAKGPRKTLTNQLSSSPPAVHKEITENLSEEEEIRRAAKLIPESVWQRMP